MRMAKFLAVVAALIACARTASAADLKINELSTGKFVLTWYADDGKTKLSATTSPTWPTNLVATIVDTQTDEVLWTTTVSPAANPYNLITPDTAHAIKNAAQVAGQPPGYESHRLIIDATATGLRITDQIDYLVKRITHLP